MYKSISLEGKVAVVTGGAGGIGIETLKMMVGRGAKVAVVDIDQQRAEEAVHTLGGDAHAIAVQVDLADEQSIIEMSKKVIGHYGRLDILNNNAAALSPEMAGKDNDVEHMESWLWDKSYAVNVRGAMLVIREFMPELVKSKGNIVNTVSNLALQGHIIQLAYSSSKAALIQLTRSVAASHGRKGVRCNAVAPGMTMTPALKEAFPEHIRLMVEAETLRDQLGEPQDIAEAIAWLASDAARNVTGQVLTADGGLATHVPGFGPFSNMINDTGEV